MAFRQDTQPVIEENIFFHSFYSGIFVLIYLIPLSHFKN